MPLVYCIIIGVVDTINNNNKTKTNNAATHDMHIAKKRKHGLNPCCLQFVVYIGSVVAFLLKRMLCIDHATSLRKPDEESVTDFFRRILSSPKSSPIAIEFAELVHSDQSRYVVSFASVGHGPFTTDGIPASLKTVLKRPEIVKLTYGPELELDFPGEIDMKNLQDLQYKFLPDGEYGVHQANSRVYTELQRSWSLPTLLQAEHMLGIDKGCALEGCMACACGRILSIYRS